MDTNRIGPRLKTRYGCPVEVTIAVLGGKWKCVILWWLRQEAKSFGELKQLVFGISPKVLTHQLRELEDAGLVHRQAYREKPRRVEYSLTPYGAMLKPLTELMCEWGIKHVPEDQLGWLDLPELKVLIVSNETDLCNFLQSSLDPFSAQVTIAISEDEALKQFRQQQPDVLVVDVAMQNNGGFQMIEQIRTLEGTQDRQVSAIALTSQDNFERQQALRLGFQVRVTKPIERIEFIATLVSLSNKLGSD